MKVGIPCDLLEKHYFFCAVNKFSAKLGIKVQIYNANFLQIAHVYIHTSTHSP